MSEKKDIDPKLGNKHKLGGGFNYFFMLTPKIGEIIKFD